MLAVDAGTILVSTTNPVVIFTSLSYKCVVIFVVNPYQDEDAFFGAVQHLRERVHVVMSINMPEDCSCSTSLTSSKVKICEDRPLDKVSGAFICEAQETMGFANRRANLIVFLLDWVVVSPCEHVPQYL